MNDLLIKLVGENRDDDVQQVVHSFYTFFSDDRFFHCLFFIHSFIVYIMYMYMAHSFMNDFAIWWWWKTYIHTHTHICHHDYYHRLLSIDVDPVGCRCRQSLWWRWWWSTIYKYKSCHATMVMSATTTMIMFDYHHCVCD